MNIFDSRTMVDGNETLAPIETENEGDKQIGKFNPGMEKKKSLYVTEYI